MRRFATLGLLLALVLPLSASAQTDTLAQINALLQQITALQQQIKNLTPAPAVSVGAVQVGTSSNANVCVAITRTLTRGTSGADVLSLQQYLVAQGYLSADSTTGYFGALTEAAVQKLQTAKGIVSAGTPETTGFGMVGVRTRALLQQNCISSTSSTNSCAVASPPPTPCTGTWSPITNASGCTTAWQCATPLSSLSSQNACTEIALSCPLGKRDQVGPNCSHTCVDIAVSSCPLALAPSSLCAAGWQANKDVNGCTSSYSCTTSLSGTGTTNACPTYTTPTCSSGSYLQWLGNNSSGCSLGYQCLANTSPTLIVTSPGAGPSAGQSVAQGQGLAILWQSTNAPAGSVAGIWLLKNGSVNGIIARDLSASGNYSWVPTLNQPCPADSPYACNVVPGTYSVRVQLYTPSGAYLGGFPPASPVYPTYGVSAESAAFMITQ